MLVINNAKLVLTDSIFKLFINKVYLLLRDAKLLLRNSIYLQVTGFVQVMQNLESRRI